MDKDKINKKINYFLKKYPDFDVVQFIVSHKELEDLNDKHIKKIKRATCYKLCCKR